MVADPVVGALLFETSDTSGKKYETSTLETPAIIPTVRRSCLETHVPEGAFKRAEESEVQRVDSEADPSMRMLGE